MRRWEHSLTYCAQRGFRVNGYDVDDERDAKLAERERRRWSFDEGEGWWDHTKLTSEDPEVAESRERRRIAELRRQLGLPAE